MPIEALTTRFFTAINGRDWPTLSNILEDPVLVPDSNNSDGKPASVPVKDYVASIQAILTAVPDTLLQIETLITDSASTPSNLAAVRVIWQGTLRTPYAGIQQPPGHSFETYEHAFIHVDPYLGKITSISALVDTDTLRAQQPSIPRLVPAAPPPIPSQHGITTTQTPHLDAPSLRSLYATYISLINARTLDAHHLARFCHPTVTHNGTTHALPSYARLMLDAQDALRGIEFRIGDLVVDEPGQRIACRIEFVGGVPVKEICGVKPGSRNDGGSGEGKAVRFSEQAVYYLHGGKIQSVLSVVDWETARRQAGS